MNYGLVLIILILHKANTSKDIDYTNINIKNDEINSRFQFDSNIIEIIEVFQNSTNLNIFQSYNEETNSKIWPDICRNGLEQSPINIPLKYDDTTSVEKINIIKSSISKLINTTTQYDRSGVINLINNGHIEVSKLGSTFKYTLTNLTIKYPSEHTLDGKRYDLELQLIFVKNSTENIINIGSNANDKDNKRDLLIISSLFENAGSDDIDLRNLRVSLLGPIYQFNPSKFIPISTPFYFYEGSTTTPNCEERVDWIINKNTFTTSVPQMNNIISWLYLSYPIKGNNRALKESSSRMIYFQLNNQKPKATAYSKILNSICLLFILIIYII